LAGYLLLDAEDRYRIDTVGLCLTRSATLASWPVGAYLELLGACRRDLAVFRSVFNEFLEGCTADVEPYKQEEEDRVRSRLQRLAPVAAPGHCPVCTQPFASGRQPWRSAQPGAAAEPRPCSAASYGPGDPGLLLPHQRKQRLDLPDETEIMSLTARC
jgi:hypothetical protein